MAKIKTRFVCQKCGYFTTKWLGRCPECSNWNSFVEEIEKKNDENVRKVGVGSSEKPVKLSEIKMSNEDRFTTNINELDQV